MEKKKKITASFKTSEELWSEFTEKYGKNRARKLREFMRRDLACPHCKESLKDEVEEVESYDLIRIHFSRCPSCKKKITFLWDEKLQKVRGIKIYEPEDEPKFD